MLIAGSTGTIFQKSSSSESINPLLVRMASISALGVMTFAFLTDSKSIFPGRDCRCRLFLSSIKQVGQDLTGVKNKKPGL